MLAAPLFPRSSSGHPVHFIGPKVAGYFVGGQLSPAITPDLRRSFLVVPPMVLLMGQQVPSGFHPGRQDNQSSDFMSRPVVKIGCVVGVRAASLPVDELVVRIIRAGHPGPVQLHVVQPVSNCVERTRPDAVDSLACGETIQSNRLTCPSKAPKTHIGAYRPV